METEVITMARKSPVFNFSIICSNMTLNNLRHMRPSLYLKGMPGHRKIQFSHETTSFNQFIIEMSGSRNFN